MWGAALPRLADPVGTRAAESPRSVWPWVGAGAEHLLRRPFLGRNGGPFAAPLPRSCRALCHTCGALLQL
eukprot:7477745-Alexandrium_andersonii.AAC.1